MPLGELRPGGHFHAFEFEKTYWWYAARLRILERLIAEWVGQPRSILDVGCGTGLTLAHFSRNGLAIGLDTSAEALSLAGGEARGRVVRGRVEELPFRPKQFDLVLLLDVLEHTEDDRRCLRAVWAGLRPGGTVIITVPAHEWLWGRIDEVAGHFRRYGRNGLGNVVGTSGLILDHISYFNSLLFPVGVLFKLLERPLMRKRPESEFLPKLSPRLNQLLRWAFGLERYWVPRWRVGVGLSLLAVAHREV